MEIKLITNYEEVIDMFIIVKDWYGNITPLFPIKLII